jgi:hypothetical protein
VDALRELRKKGKKSNGKEVNDIFKKNKWLKNKENIKNKRITEN